MNNTFLTNEEIAELKAIRTKRINDADIDILKSFLNENDKEISINQPDNVDNTFDIILLYATNKILKQPEYDIFKDELSKGGSPKSIVNQLLQKLSPRLYKILQTAINTNFVNAIEEINHKAKEFLNNESFDTKSFILNKNFDFSPYTIDKCDKKLIENTIAINSAVVKFVDFICKDLNQEQKEIFTKNLYNNILVYFNNSTPAVVKEKNLEFKKLVKHTYNITNDITEEENINDIYIPFMAKKQEMKNYFL